MFVFSSAYFVEGTSFPPSTSSSNSVFNKHKLIKHGTIKVHDMYLLTISKLPLQNLTINGCAFRLHLVAEAPS